MWDDLLRIDWDRLHHAYGRARDVPRILREIVSHDEEVREKGWADFYSFLYHQGSVYDATVAAIPFLIEAAGRDEVPGRGEILGVLQELWHMAPIHNADPMLDDPPGGLDEPTPWLADQEISGEAVDETDEFDLSRYRRMDLCAWQVGRAIRAGRPVYERLMDDPDRAVATDAAELLCLWPETSDKGKEFLLRMIEHETDPVEQSRRILRLGSQGEADDAEIYAQWIDPAFPGVVRAAAALAWAWLVDPDPLPRPAARTLQETSAHDSDAFAKLPWDGFWVSGPWVLPSNAAALVLRLASNRDNKLRWRSVEGLDQRRGREVVRHLPDGRVVPVLIERLADEDSRVREAAATALSQRGGLVYTIDPGVVPALLRTLGDADPSTCGHSARLLAAFSERLTPVQRAGAIAGIDQAIGRFLGKKRAVVSFTYSAREATVYLKEQRERIVNPRAWGVRELFAAIGTRHRHEGTLPVLECDRRLAEAYAEDPAGVINVAIEVVRERLDCDAALGAADWLATLGPAAAPALTALESDAFFQESAWSSIAFIRWSMEVQPEPVEVVPADPVGALSDPDPILRARAAARIGSMPLDGLEIAAAVPELIRMLDDEASAEVGQSGVFEIDGHVDHWLLDGAAGGEVARHRWFEQGSRIHHWQRRRWSPRVEAIRALTRLGRVPEGHRMLRALIAESRHLEIVSARHAKRPHHFVIETWRAAVVAVGGISDGGPAIRAARLWAEAVCKIELDRVIRRLEARLGGGP